MNDEDLIAEQEQKAEAVFHELEGQHLDVLRLTSEGPGEAGFLAGIVSKLSPIIANLLEKQVVDALNSGSTGSCRWIRQDPDFPDVLLLNSAGAATDFGYEIKAWFVTSTEITGRFRDSLNLLAHKRIRVAVIAWHMSDLVFGQPRILGTYSTDAEGFATVRDQHYYRPPDYLLEEPGDTTGRTRNLIKSNVKGYKWQETEPDRVAEAKSLMERHPGNGMPSHTPEAQELVKDLRSEFYYREDTNFSKIDRIDHKGLEAFKTRCLETHWKGKALQDWRTCFNSLNKSPDSSAGRQALRSVQALYRGAVT